MHLFQGETADQVWHEVAAVFRAGEKPRLVGQGNDANRELLHVALTLANPIQRWVVSRELPLNIAFVLAEVVWMVAGRRDLRFLHYWNRDLPNYVGPGPELHGAYGHRLRSNLGLDQLTRAYEALQGNCLSRQVVLQIWDSAIDMPDSTGRPRDTDIPCNLVSILKVRGSRLEWLQVLRSNDLYLGVPHNIVQFTSLQEIMAGWLGIECGIYNQISDSMHLYLRDQDHLAASRPLRDVAMNSDSLALPFGESARVFGELERRVDDLVRRRPTALEFAHLTRWSDLPQAYRNIFLVLVAEAARRSKELDSATEAIRCCDNPVYQQLWQRWMRRVGCSQLCVDRLAEM